MYAFCNEKKMKWNGKLLPILFGISLTTFSLSIAILLYPLLVKNKNDGEEKKYWSKKSENVVTSRKSKLEVTVPKQCVSAIIGKGGSVIKDIQAKTSTHITIEKNKDLDSPYVKLIIQSDEMEYIMLAKYLIDEKVENQQNIEIRKMIFLPNNQYDQISHEAKYIERASGAKLIFLHNPLKESGKGHINKLLIRGTDKQIEKAVHEIEKINLEHEGDCKNTNDTLMSVYVSAIESPDRFWIQIIGPKLNEFEEFEKEMADHYENNHTRELCYLSKIEVNKIVAAKHENKWYRAEIIDVNLPLCTVYLLDYGKTVKDFSTSNIFELRTDMLSLRVQAIECKLGFICPLESQHEWSSNAIQMFSTLVQPGKKKAVIAKGLDYVKRSNTLYDKNEWIPELVLYLDNFTNVAQTLLDLQLAKARISPPPDLSETIKRMQDAKQNVNESKE